MSFPTRVLIASNRLPFTVRNDHGRVELAPTCGGLAAALTAVHRRSDSVWIGWPGDCSALDDEQRATLPEHLRDRHVHPVDIAAHELTDYYDGVCNSVLWPALHYFIDRIPVV